MELRYRDLTKEELDFLIKSGELNGCGSKGGWFAVPSFIFAASCYHHDFNYWLGHTEEDRRKADKQFYCAMLGDASIYPWYKRYLYNSLAWTYYVAVRLFASKFFYYADEERNREYLEELMSNG